MKFFALVQAVNIDQKLKHAPDNGYAIGVWIGNLAPFVLLVGLAYWMYYRSKNRKDLE
jgi:formate/nitrite transporter FocA (FNT family)